MHAVMRSAALPIIALAAGALAGCSSGGGDSGPDYEVADHNVTGPKTPPPAAPDSAEEPVNPAPDEVTDPGPATPWVEGDAGADDGGAMDGGATSDAGATPVTRVVSCTSAYGSHRSVSKLTWVVSGQNAVIKSLYVTVTNSYHRNANDVDVWVTYPGHAEYKAFNSGDVLASGRTVSVKLPASWTKPLGTRIRLETNFDQSGFDPSASCSITLTK